MHKKVNLIIEAIKKDKDVLAVILFGSYAKNEEYRDIDVCLVLYPKKYNSLQLSEKKLRYAAESGDVIDVQIFQQLPLYIKTRVLKEGKVLFCKNEDLLYDIAFRTIKEYEDFKPIYHSYLKGVAGA